MKKFRSRLVNEWLAVAGFLAVLAACAAGGSWFSRMDLVFYDLALKTWQRPGSSDIVIVAADEASLNAIGRWPWRRAVHATLLDRLTRAGAKAVGMDLILDQADSRDSASDSAFASALERNGRTVLPVTLVPGEGGKWDVLPPLPAFADRAAALGFANARVDPDGIARSVWLAEGGGTADTPHFAYAVLQIADPKSFPPQVPLAGSGNTWRRAYPLLIPFAGPPGHFRTVSYVDVLTGKVPPEAFRDKIVLVGVTAAGIGDNNPVPTSGSGGVMSGVEISANVIDTLCLEIALRALPPGAAALLSLILVLALMVLLRRTSPRLGLGISFGATLLFLAGCILLMRFGQAWVPPSATLVCFALAYPLWSWRRLEATQRFLDTELALLEREKGILPAEPVLEGLTDDAMQMRLDRVRAATARQRDARRFLADVLDSLPAGMLVADRSGRVVLANRRAAILLGLREGRDPVGVPMAEILSRLKPASGGEGGLGGAQNQSMQALKMEVMSPSAQALLLDVAPCRGDHGRYLGLVASLTDVAELRAAQKARDESMRFLSHDMRSPLTTIVTLLDDAEDDDADPASQKSLLERIGTYARRALNLADSMLRLARAEALDPANFEELDLHAVLLEAADEIWPVATAKGIGLHLPEFVESGKNETDHKDAQGDLQAIVKGDGDLLRRAFINLLSNAVKYSPQGSAVGLRLEAAPAGWKVSVSDQGRGIPADKLPKLFTRYGRFTAGHDYVEGIGLGLVIVKAVVSAHRGRIEVESEPGQGTKFFIYLPGLDQHGL